MHHIMGPLVKGEALGIVLQEKDVDIKVVYKKYGTK